MRSVLERDDFLRFRVPVLECTRVVGKVRRDCLESEWKASWDPDRPYEGAK